MGPQDGRATKFHFLSPCGLRCCSFWEYEKHLKVQLDFHVYYCQINAKDKKLPFTKKKLHSCGIIQEPPHFMRTACFGLTYIEGRGRRWGDMQGKARGETSRSCPRTVMPS